MSATRSVASETPESPDIEAPGHLQGGKLSAPLTPADSDLRDFPFLQLDVARLRDSDLAMTQTPEACWSAVLLWCASWHQVPAASLPDDDRVLSHLAGFGRVVRAWRKVKAGALHGWVKCEDGRLYHPVVAEKARECWKSKLHQRWMTECARIKKHAERSKIELVAPAFEEWLAAGRPCGQLLPNVSGPALLNPCPALVPATDHDFTAPVTVTDPVCHATVPCDMASKGEGEGKGEREINTSSSTRATFPPLDLPDDDDVSDETQGQAEKPAARPAWTDDQVPGTPAQWADVFEQQHGHRIDLDRRKAAEKFTPLAAGWIAAGVTVGQMAAACTRAWERADEPIAYLPGFVDRVLATMQISAKAVAATGAPAGVDLVRTTVPGRQGRDPVLAQIEQDMSNAAPITPEIRAKIAALKSSLGARAGAVA